MEALQSSYVRAVAASAGCTIQGVPEIDEGIDLLLRHSSVQHVARDGVARLEVQMKATHRFNTSEISPVSVRLRQDRYNELVLPNPTVDRILVVMCIPQNQAHWSYTRPKGLTVHHCCYWANLAGNPAATAHQPTATLSRQNVFDDVALCDIMERMGRGGAP